jgi:hypothetical protein
VLQLPADKTLGKEEEDPAGALASVDVAGVVAVAVVAGAAARAVARERGAAGVVDVRIGGGSGTGVGTLGEEELPTPPASSKWTYSIVKSS